MIVLDKNGIGIVAVSAPWIKEGKPGYSLHQHGFSFRVGEPCYGLLYADRWYNYPYVLTSYRIKPTSPNV